MCIDPLVKIIIQTSFALQNLWLSWEGANPGDHNLQAKNFEKFEMEKTILL